MKIKVLAGLLLVSTLPQQTYTMSEAELTEKILNNAEHNRQITLAAFVTPTELCDPRIPFLDINQARVDQNTLLKEAFLPILKLQEEHSYKFVTVDIKKCSPEFLKQHAITNSPTFIVFKGNKEVHRMPERITKENLLKLVEVATKRTITPNSSLGSVAGSVRSTSSITPSMNSKTSLFGSPQFPRHQNNDGIVNEEDEEEEVIID